MYFSIRSHMFNGLCCNRQTYDSTLTLCIQINLQKTLQLLKVNDILKVQQLKFYFSLIHNKLPIYFNCFNFSRNYHFHNYFTRLSKHFHVANVKHTFATKCLRLSLPTLLKYIPSCITDKYFTHSINGFATYVKNYYLTSYSSQCLIPNCYVCNH